MYTTHKKSIYLYFCNRYLATSDTKHNKIQNKILQLYIISIKEHLFMKQDALDSNSIISHKFQWKKQNDKMRLQMITNFKLTRTVPSGEKHKLDTDVGYLWNWQSLFLLAPSQMLTRPSEPPVANVLYSRWKEMALT